MIKSRLLPGEADTINDVHDFCRVRRFPITADHPLQIHDLLAMEGCWDRKYMVMAITTGNCGKCQKGKVYGKCRLIELQFLGSYYATGHVVEAKQKRGRERWECEWGFDHFYARVKSRFRLNIADQRVCDG